MLTQESIATAAVSRKDFLRSMGLGGAALMAVLASCQNSGDIVTPSSVTVDISTKITTVGSYIYSNGVIIARISAGSTASSFVAVAQACTHEGTSVVYQSTGRFYCPNHGATYSTSGAVTQGPATKALTKYTVAINGTTLTIS